MPKASDNATFLSSPSLSPKVSSSRERIVLIVTVPATILEFILIESGVSYWFFPGDRSGVSSRETIGPRLGWGWFPKRKLFQLQKKGEWVQMP